MSRNKILFFTGLILFGIVIRMIPYLIPLFNNGVTVHSTYLPWNFSPMTGICLFSGAVLAARFSFLIPIFMLLVCDLGIYMATGKAEWTVFSNKPLFYVTYLSIIMIVLSGNHYLRKYNFGKIILTGVVAEVLFFFVTNGASWWYGGMFPHTIDGLINCYLAGLPFVGRSIVSTVIYAPAIFYSYQYICLGQTEKTSNPESVPAETGVEKSYS